MVLRANEERNVANALHKLAECEPGGVDLQTYAIARNLRDDTVESVMRSAALVTVQVNERRAAITRQRKQYMQRTIIDALKRYHDEQAEAIGASAKDILRVFPEPKQRILAQICIEELVDDRQLTRFGHLLHLPGHSIKFSAEDQILWQEVENILRTSAVDQPRLSRLAAEVDLR
ncbi:MAG: hypothetical protein GTO41_11980, partial [Burkholderiales bacterium]|nr:hypothetical protein [Burkholderiales bacterium]